MYRIRRKAQVPDIGLFAIEEIEPRVRARPLVRSPIKEITEGQRSSRHPSRRSRMGIKRIDRSLTVDPDLWP
jgi:hypothetical protein